MQQEPAHAGLAPVTRIGQDPGLLTFELVREWKRYLGVREYSESTLDTYVWALFRFLGVALKPLPDVTEADVIDYLERLKPQGSARQLTIRALRSFYGWATERELLRSNPVRFIKSKHRKYGPAPYLTHDEVTRLLVAAAWRDPRRAWAMLLMYATGARLESLAAVEPEDVKDGRIYFRRAKNRMPYAVPLNRLGAEAAKELMALPPPHIGRPRQDPGLRTLVGVRGSRFWQWVNQAGEDCGLHVWPHLLGHSFATRLAEARVPSTVIAELLNHHDLGTLQRYVGIADPVKKAAVDLMDSKKEGELI